jgi:hypothetical protein
METIRRYKMFAGGDRAAAGRRARPPVPGTPRG